MPNPAIPVDSPQARSLVVAAVVAFAAFAPGTAETGSALILASMVAVIAPQLVPVRLLVSAIPLNIYVAWCEGSAIGYGLLEYCV